MSMCVMECMKTFIQQCVKDFVHKIPKICTHTFSIFNFQFLIVDLQTILKKKTSTTPFHWFLVCDKIMDMQ